MSGVIKLGRYASIEAAAAALRAAVATPPDAAGLAGWRWEAEVPDTEPLAWLHHHRHLIRMYCSHRERRLQIAALGCADVARFKNQNEAPAEALAAVMARLQDLPVGARYYGGMRFNDAPRPDDPTWRRFGRVRFVLPSVELIRKESATILAVNRMAEEVTLPGFGGVLEELAGQRTPPPLPAAHLPAPLARHNDPDREQWEQMMAQASGLFAEDRLKKIVLARRCTFTFDQPLDPMALLQRLHEASPDSFHFCFNYGDEIAFIGATPERLYRRAARHIDSEALAGTRPRGASEDDDAWLAADLMASAKERKEHRLVADSICDTLEGLCQSVTRHPDPEVLRLRYVQHLRTLIAGELEASVTDADLLAALHPTPAVGGLPQAEALHWIDRLEPFDRGWYAAPIGWLHRHEAEFAVAIRCGLVEGARLNIFSGAGIMPESDPEQEWREIESKIGNFVRVLTT